MIVNVRGTNGSGKTRAVQDLLGKAEVKNDNGLVYTTNGEIVALGVYDGRKFGGCDMISSQAEIRASVVRLACEFDKVVFEGVLASGTFMPYLLLSRTLREEVGRGIDFAFMNTPLNVCLDRIRARNGGAAFDEAGVAEKFIRIANIKQRLEAEGEKTHHVANGDDLRRLFHG